jgi:hypothetical protein
MQLAPHIKYVMDKYRKKLSKQDLKRFAKEIGKILTASDFKHKRVEDPTKITEYHEKKVKKSVRDYFDKAVAKKAAYDTKKAEKKAAEALKNGQESAGSALNGRDPSATAEASTPLGAEEKAELSDVELSDDEDAVEPSVPVTPTGGSSEDETLKRKRDDDNETAFTQCGEIFVKRWKGDETAEVTVINPAPPPPPEGAPPVDAQMLDAQMLDDGALYQEPQEDLAAAELKAAEEALERENEEAAAMEALSKIEVQPTKGHTIGEGFTMNGNGEALMDNANGEMEGLMQSERKEVLSH